MSIATSEPLPLSSRSVVECGCPLPLSPAVESHPVSPTTPALHLLFTIPEDDASQALFHSLPNTAKAPVRDDVDRTLLALESIHGAAKVNPEIKRLATAYSGRPGFTFNSLRAKYYWYTRTGKKDQYGNVEFPPGDWRMLVNWSKVPVRNRPGQTALGSNNTGLPSAFIEYLKGLYGSNQRKSEPAIRKLYALWRAGESIPGYGTWEEWFQSENPHLPLPDHCPPDLPRGWHKSNLRKHIPADAELALSRHGKFAALSLLPCILQTRDGLRPLEYIEFDDFRTDFKVLVPGYASPVELNGLVAIDVATGRPLRYGLRAAIPREDGMKDKLKLHDMKVLIAGILLQYGLPRTYTMHLIVENATATVRDAFALALGELFRSTQCSQPASAVSESVKSDSVSSPTHSVTHSLIHNSSIPAIVVERTEIIQGTALWSGYKDRPGGNPRGKPHVESTFNLFHNEAGFIAGQIGRRYDAGPSDLHGRTREAESLARVGRHLTPHQRAALKAPFLNYAEARVVCTDIWNRIYHRTDHQMEAFQTIGEFRVCAASSPERGCAGAEGASRSTSNSPAFTQWLPDGLLATDEYALVPRAQIEWRNPPRKESPAERWERLCFDLVNSPQTARSVWTAASEFRPPLSDSVPPSPFRKPHPSAIARLYDEHKLRPVVNYEITFDHDKEHCVYRLANIQFASASALNFLRQKNAQALCYYDPQDLSLIHCTDGQGGYLGSIPRTRGIRKTDKDALKADYDRKQREYQALKDLVSSRLPEAAEQRLEEIDHNCEVLKQALENGDVLQEQTEKSENPSAVSVESVSSVSSVSSCSNSGSSVADSIASHRALTAVQQRQARAESARIAKAPRSLKSILNGHEARTS